MFGALSKRSTSRPTVGLRNRKPVVRILSACKRIFGKSLKRRARCWLAPEPGRWGSGPNTTHQDRGGTVGATGRQRQSQPLGTNTTMPVSSRLETERPACDPDQGRIIRPQEPSGSLGRSRSRFHGRDLGSTCGRGVRPTGRAGRMKQESLERPERLPMFSCSCPSRSSKRIVRSDTERCDGPSTCQQLRSGRHWANGGAEPNGAPLGGRARRDLRFPPVCLRHTRSVPRRLLRSSNTLDASHGRVTRLIGSLSRHPWEMRISRIPRRWLA